MKHLLFAFVAVCVSGLLSPATAQVDKQIIAREKAAIEAWQKKDKAFWSNFLTDDATYIGAMSPYRDSDPKVNFLPKFEQHVEDFQIVDFSMMDPIVQVYGDVAILTYYENVTALIHMNPLTYSGKVTAVYVKQGGTWKMAHGHESINPKAD